MAVRWLRRLAASASVPVFPVVGGGARYPVQDLNSRFEVELVPTPRWASVLLVAGQLPRSLVYPAQQVHDQMPHPRATVWWANGSNNDVVRTFPAATVIEADADVVGVLRRVQAALLAGQRASEPSLLPQVPPSPWKGVGPHGQGGEGMMGGRPYGRPMAMTGPDRDGLELDRLPLRVGPFFAAFPPGLAVEMVLQGDVVEEAQPAPNPFSPKEPMGGPVGGPLTGITSPFRSALHTPATIAVLELARARSHLRWLAHALWVHGLSALAVRTLGMARKVHPAQLPALRRLRRVIQGNPTIRWATEGIGVLEAHRLPDGVSGPVARAAGVTHDARSADPAYAELGFAPVSQTAGDCWTRMRQRLAEAEQALELAARAESLGLRTGYQGVVEGPRGPVTEAGSSAAPLVNLLPELLSGSEWSEAVTTIVSLDLDLEEEHDHVPEVAR